MKGKGSSNPLLDTGFMHDNVTYLVVKLMARTLSASPIDPNNPAMGDDIGNFVVEGLGILASTPEATAGVP